MKYKVLIFSFLYLCHLNGYELSEYEAKYKFDSKEISITGIREFKKTQNGYEIRFDASNLLASLFFSSKFSINKIFYQISCFLKPISCCNSERMHASSYIRKFF